MKRIRVSADKSTAKWENHQDGWNIVDRARLMACPRCVRVSRIEAGMRWKWDAAASEIIEFHIRENWNIFGKLRARFCAYVALCTRTANKNERKRKRAHAICISAEWAEQRSKQPFGCCANHSGMNTNRYDRRARKPSRVQFSRPDWCGEMYTNLAWRVCM